VTATTNLNDAESVIALLDGAAERIAGSRYADHCVVRLPAAGRLVATGDLHDNPFHLEKIVRVARLDASRDHHVVLHEMIHSEKLVNGMDFSYRMLARVAELVTAYPDQVHPVLANHELAQMTRKGVSKGAGNSVELFEDGLEFVFGERSEEVAGAIRALIRAMPIAVISGGGVLCAHSLPDARMMPRFDTALFERDLDDEDYLAPHGAAYLMTWGRGYDDAQVETLAKRWNVRLFCLGHQHAETGIEMRGKRVIVLNSDHERATVLPLDLADVPGAEEALMHAIPLCSVA
jgi:hypothetical protein